MAQLDTRARLLDAAERLFAENGIASTSLRVLTRSAGVNLAAVHYHFGSKEGLLDAVLERHARPMNEARLAELAALEAAAGAQGPCVEEILTAFVLPGARLHPDPARRELLSRLRARIEAQPPASVEALFRAHFGTVCSIFVDALCRALPELSKETVADRFRLALGALSFAFSGNFDLDTLPGHPAAATAFEDKLRCTIAFLTAGLSAPESTESHR